MDQLPMVPRPSAAAAALSGAAPRGTFLASQADGGGGTAFGEVGDQDSLRPYTSGGLDAEDEVCPYQSCFPFLHQPANHCFPIWQHLTLKKKKKLPKGL